MDSDWLAAIQRCQVWKSLTKMDFNMEFFLLAQTPGNVHV